MNERSEFDKLLRDRLEGLTEPAPDVWEGIQRGLERHRRAVIFRRFSVGVAAAAAGLAIAWLIFRGPRDGEPLQAPVQTAQNVEITQPAQAPADPVEINSVETEIAPIAEQVAAFTRRQAVAQAEKVEKPSTREAVTETTPVVPAETPKEETPVDNPAAVQVDTPADNPAVTPAEGQGQLTETDLPADYWDIEEESRTRHTSHITILSNLTAVASENDLMYKASPSHASSQSGTSQATSSVEPLSGSPKFYAPLSFGLQIATALTDRLSVATGLRYTYLVSQYDMLVNKEKFEGAFNQLHYVGIPLEMSYHLVQTRSFGFYALLGGAAEKCVSQRYVYGSNTLHEKVGGLQWSAQAGIGAEYWFVPRAGIYFDPSLVYYFDNHQPLSIRTQQPLQARFEVGLRFKL